jgi:hypothetical protein
MTVRFVPALLDVLKRAGWYEGRNIEETIAPPKEFSIFARARRAWAEFGGLRIGDAGPGIDCATSDVDFDPRLETGLEPELRRYECLHNTRLFPLAEVHRGHGCLAIDEQGRTYLLSQVSDDISRFAPTLDRSLAHSLARQKGEPPGDRKRVAWGGRVTAVG